MPEAVLAGRLEHVTLPSLLQLVEAESTSGTITLGDEAGLGLSSGLVVAARFGRFEGRPALLECFLLNAGAFQVELGDSAPARPLADTLELVMTGCRLADEWTRLAPSAARVTGPLEDPQLAPLVPHLGSGSLDHAVRRAGVLRVSVIDPLLAALEKGRLTLAASASPATPPPAAGETDVGALVDQARIRTRERKFEEAEALLATALSHAPGDRVVAQNLARVRALRAASADIHETR